MTCINIHPLSLNACNPEAGRNTILLFTHKRESLCLCCSETPKLFAMNCHVISRPVKCEVSWDLVGINTPGKSQSLIKNLVQLGSPWRLKRDLPEGSGTV